MDRQTVSLGIQVNTALAMRVDVPALQMTHKC